MTTTPDSPQPSDSKSRSSESRDAALLDRVTRIVIDAEGAAVRPSKTGGPGFGSIETVIVFERDDGWLLGAPDEFRDVAFKLWAEAWVFLALHTWGKRSHQGTVSWIKELMVCEKLRVVIVTEALMTSKANTSWRGPAQIWLDQQRTCARTCPYL